MRVFSTFDNRPADNDTSKRASKKKRGAKKGKQSYRPPRDNLSAEEIRAKVATKTTKAARKKAANKTGKQVSTFMSVNTDVQKVKISPKAKAASTAANKVDAVKEPVIETKQESKETKNIMLQSDIAANDPTDTNTQEKLRGLLSAGGFGWNDKERAALSEILGQA